MLTILSSIRFDRSDLKSSVMHLMTLWRLAEAFVFSLTRFSGFSQAYVSFMVYLSPKNQVSLKPTVRHTRSNRSLPFHFTWEIGIMRPVIEP